MAIGRGQGALWAGMVKAEINRTESIQQMIAVFFQSVIALEVTNSRERLI